MICKELPVPLMLILTEIMKYRLIPGHFKHAEIERDLAKRWAGFWGEITLATYVKELPQDKYLIFHDIQLQLNGIHFQIDTLLISKSYILILEAKNIIGTLFFDNLFKQLIRKNEDGSEEAFEDPRVQCQRLQSLLKRWMIKNGLNLLPIDYLVFFKSVNTILKTTPGEIADFSRVCKARDIFNKIEVMENRYTHEWIDNQALNSMSKILLSQHSQKQINILEKYALMQKDIRSGVRCPECLNIAMNYKRGKWRCPICKISCKDAHIESLNDYFYLYKPFISNSEFRHFLHISSNDIAQKILLSLKLPSTGTTKDRKYHLHPKGDSLCVLP
ncbi:nuclease-related domain-containing protein [Paenibacillus sp. BSR1-1]|uniref:nuclease-related domain-containing protein n=1 Tax=Paenibacillus sp. BSR1-1 TaxID=3020845 RepID=UPI0025B12A10|nr:nuclease-related domain-containing protein [Paenibacillus sp. BSR1-1]MDN3019024.1 nuclease-related domain-containing protein [Paenibacillus sp. BSR1-1]